MTALRRLALATGAFVGAGVVALATAAALTPWSRPAEAVIEVEPWAPAPPEPELATARASVSVPLRDGESAAGWLVRPVLGEPSHAVVLVAGAGESGRDDLLPLAQAFSSAGVVALTIDKRTAASSALSRDFDRLAEDAVDAGRFLRDLPLTATSRISVLGFSEGGWVAPRAAAAAPHVFSAMILVSPSVVTPLAQAAWVVDGMLADGPDAIRRLAGAGVAGGRAFLDYLDAGADAALRAIDVPVYAVWGGDDSTAPVASAALRLAELVDSPLVRTVLPHQGHDPATSVWSADAARWLDSPTGTTGVRGVEPATLRSAPQPPPASAVQDPRWHAAFALTVAIGTFLALRPRRPRSTRSLHASSSTRKAHP